MRVLPWVPVHFVLWCWFVGSPPSVLSAELGISAKAEVDQAFITIGDEIRFTVSASHLPDIKVTQFRTDEALIDFEIKSVKRFSYRKEGLVVEGQRYVITNYELGEYVIRPIVIDYETANGEQSRLETETLYITVESVDKNKDPESDIRPVKGVRGIRGAPWLWFVMLGLGGSLVGVGLWRCFRKPRVGGNGIPPAPLSPHEEAYQALNRLTHSDLLAKGNLKLYFFRMSEILRLYFQRRFQVNALELTTSELLLELRDKLRADDVRLVGEVLRFCDLVKFAKMVPPPGEILRENQEAKAVLDRTKLEISETVSTQDV